MVALQYLESLRNYHPDLDEWYNSLLTLKLDQFIALAVFQARDALILLSHNFITYFETKINILKLAHFAVIVSQQYPLLDDGKSTLDSMTDIDPFVYANYYWVSSQYYKVCQEFAGFYKSALLYLAYTSVEFLSDSFKLDLAFDLSLSTLLGDNIYNLGELLAHPIIKSLIGSKVETLVSYSLTPIGIISKRYFFFSLSFDPWIVKWLVSVKEIKVLLDELH
ncbi:hypothetical protein UlMin_010452 [Ulmus minor]